MYFTIRTVESDGMQTDQILGKSYSKISDKEHPIFKQMLDDVQNTNKLIEGLNKRAGIDMEGMSEPVCFIYVPDGSETIPIYRGIMYFIMINGNTHEKIFYAKENNVQVSPESVKSYMNVNGEVVISGAVNSITDTFKPQELTEEEKKRISEKYTHPKANNWDKAFVSSGVIGDVLERHKNSNLYCNGSGVLSSVIESFEFEVYQWMSSKKTRLNAYKHENDYYVKLNELKDILVVYDDFYTKPHLIIKGYRYFKFEYVIELLYKRRFTFVAEEYEQFINSLRQFNNVLPPMDETEETVTRIYYSTDYERRYSEYNIEIQGLGMFKGDIIFSELGYAGFIKIYDVNKILGQYAPKYFITRICHKGEYWISLEEALKHFNVFKKSVYDNFSHFYCKKVEKLNEVIAQRNK